MTKIITSSSKNETMDITKDVPVSWVETKGLPKPAENS